MNQYLRTAPMGWMIISALVAALLVGCASESSPRIPAPPPFVPKNVVVTLGDNGGATTLVSTQAGGWTHNGQPFSTGSTVRGENTATYRLTLSGDSWSATYVPPDPAQVRLGNSGDTVTLNLREDGTYLLDAAAVQSGHIVEAANGNRYTLSLGADGDWSAAFHPPDPLHVPLGTSGDAVSIEIGEDQNFWLGGSRLSSGRVVNATNGNRYTLSLQADGGWSAAFLAPAPVRLPLGISGDTVSIEIGENQDFRLGGSRLHSGRVVSAANGNRYTLSLRADGNWSAAFLAPAPVRIPLGASGDTVSIEIGEDQNFWLGGSRLSSGRVVEANNGNRYTLSLRADGKWSAAFLAPDPLRIPLGISGDAVSVEIRENQSLWLDGSRLRSGRVVRAANGNRYALSLQADGNWSAEFLAPNPVRVQLGASGETVSIEIREDQDFWLDGSRLRTGHVVEADNGNRYTLSLRADGKWYAAFLAPDPVRVPLGSSGDEVRVAIRENGDFWLEGLPLRTGRVVRARNGNRYTLTLADDGMWGAIFVQPDPQRVVLGSSGRTVLVSRDGKRHFPARWRVIVVRRGPWDRRWYQVQVHTRRQQALVSHFCGRARDSALRGPRRHETSCPPRKRHLDAGGTDHPQRS